MSQIVPKLLRLGVSVFILVLLFRKIPLTELTVVLSNARLFPILITFLVALLLQLAIAYRLKLLTDAQGLPLSILTIFEINLATLFYGLFLVGGNLTAIIIRVYKLSSKHKQFTSIVVALFFDRIVATVTLCLAGILFWILEQPPLSKLVLWFMLFSLGLLVIPLLLLFADFSFFPVLAVLKKNIGRLRRGKFSSLWTAGQQLCSLPREKLAQVFALSFFVHTLGIVSYYVLAGSLNLELSFLTIGWIRSMTILVTMIPISISGLGLREGAMLVLLQDYGVGNEQALAFSLLVFLSTVFAVGMVGGLFEARRFLR